MGVRDRQERERQAVRQAILDAARELFTAEGYRTVSMRKIAERIEYSPAALYGYFPGKADIFFALAEEGFRLLQAYGRDATAGVDDPLDRIRRGLLAFYRFGREHPQYFELMFVDRSVPSITADFQRFEFFHAARAAARDDIRACMDRGIFAATLDPAAALRTLWVSLLGVVTAALGGRLAPGQDPDAVAQDVLDTLLAGFRAQPSSDV